MHTFVGRSWTCWCTGKGILYTPQNVLGNEQACQISQSFSLQKCAYWVCAGFSLNAVFAVDIFHEKKTPCQCWIGLARKAIVIGVV